MKLINLTKTLLLAILLSLSAGRGNAAPLGTDFLYQGLLTVAGSPANGVHQMVFTLFRPGVPAPGPSVTNNNVAVAGGVFTVSLDFGAGVFDGTAYELGIAVRAQGTSGQFVVLQPRQPLSATPNSQHARTVSSVPDTALSSNVALLNGTPVFSAGISVTLLRVTDATGGGFLRFGPTDDCSIGVNPQGPLGLLLRDPRGVRIMNPNPGPSRLLFGPTDDCSLGIDPVLVGLLLRDPNGIRVLSADSNRPPVLRFGPTDDCSLGIDPVRTGLTLRDPRGLRLLSPTPTQAPMLRFGPTDDCSLGIDPVLTGLLLRDPRGIRVLSPDTTRPPTLRFGPTDDCSIGIDPAFPGLVGRDPIGFRILGQNNTGRRLIFGPTMDCVVEANATGPQGLLLRDPRGIRILPPPALAGQPPNLPVMRFGPTDDCSLGIDPALPGLIERDPTGFRLLGQNNEGCRLIFGPTMDCTVEIQPQGPSGLLLRDPSGVRLLSPSPMMPPTLRFGPTDDCSLGIDPVVSGLLLRDPRGIRILPPATLPGQPPNLPILRFGPTDDCSLGIDPAMPGLIERDPTGFRLLGQNNEGCRLIFGPTMDCTIEVQPPGPTAVRGLLLRDPSGIRILNPTTGTPAPTNSLIFGPTDDCRITASADPQTGGMRFSDPRGFRFGSQVTVAGNVFAQSFVPTSSRRFKNDVKPIAQALEKISKLQGVSFTWTDDKGGREDIGFIAEEVGKVIPEVVSWEEDGKNARGVNYDHLVAVAIEGIKAQQTQITTLEREKAELKGSLDDMQAQLDRLTTQVQKMMAR